ncbi:hypothetical protein ACFVXQ_02750, partial [Kitasatospora sp. NPDC058263]
MDAEGQHRLEVGLDAGAAAGVGAGDDRATAELEAAVAAGDDERVAAAFQRLGGLLGLAGEAESAAVGPRLAALLPEL